MFWQLLQKKMQIGYGLDDTTYIKYKKYFYPVVANQYKKYNATNNLVETTHSGGHELPTDEVVDYFMDVLSLASGH